MTASQDRDDVVECCVRLSWYVDHKEWDKVQSLLAERVRVDYTSVFGGEAAIYTPSELVEGLSSSMGSSVATQHVQSGHLVDVVGDRAVCTTNVLGFHGPTEPIGTPHRRIGGSYRFELYRQHSTWRVADWTFTVTWAEGEQPAAPAGDRPRRP